MRTALGQGFPGRLERGRTGDLVPSALKRAHEASDLERFLVDNKNGVGHATVKGNSLAISAAVSITRSSSSNEMTCANSAGEARRPESAN